MTNCDVNDKYYDALKDGERRCRIEEIAYGRWLDILKPIRTAMLVGATALSAVAGATIFSKPEWANLAGSCAVLSAMITGIDTVLGCEVHQAECQRLILLYQTLQMQYQQAALLESEQIAKQLKELDVDFINVKKDAKAAPPLWFVERARDAVKQELD